MAKLERERVAGKVPRGRSIRRRSMSLEAKNEFLSFQIGKQMFNKNAKALKVNKVGVVTNLDYDNPNHMKWLED